VTGWWLKWRLVIGWRFKLAQTTTHYLLFVPSPFPCRVLLLPLAPKRKARGKELSTLLVENHGQKHGRAAEVRAKALDLISKGADLTVVDEDDITPLHRAANWDHPDCIGPMLKAGAQLEAKDYFGSTPLHKAALYGRLDCVGLLLKAGAEPGAKDDDGRTARDEAVQYKNNQWRAVVELLDEHAVRT